ncbi:MAG: hypothetical protein DME22_05480 [Verrucomicrobia bacterium]|nr:MAG: hypothetical protein DME22_05480 [Verrucomicrobiota bacterium]PYK00150.1 MAG: hypothetical protein DME23_08095 [Verrucomicrobiota bacterium]
MQTATAVATTANLPYVALTETGPMKLRFEVNQAECFRRGIDCPKSIITIEVEPSKLPKDVRELIADRMMDGIDVCRLRLSEGGSEPNYIPNPDRGDCAPDRLIAKEPTFDGLLEAIEEDQKRIEKEVAQQKKG